MLLLRLILIFLICYIVYSAVKSALIGGRTKTSQRRKFNEAKEEEEMVLDPQCHSYVPKSDAIAKSGVYFCSQECARLYLSR